MAGAGQERMAMYKRRGAGTSRLEDRRKQLAAQRRNARDKVRTETFATNRGLENLDTVSAPIHPVPALNKREQKLLEWKRKKQLYGKAPSADKPAFIVKKITYNDAHLYQPPESTSFKPPKGVKPVKTPQSTRKLRSQTRIKLQGSQAVEEAIKSFASGLALLSKKKSAKETPRTNKRAVLDLLNRTFDGSLPLDPEVGNQESQILNLQSTDFEENVGSPIQHLLMQPQSHKEPTQMPVNPEVTVPEFSGGRDKMPQTERKSNRIVKKKSVKIVPEDTVFEKSAQHFRSLYDDAVAKLNLLCDEWTNAQIQGLPDNANDQVDVAVGYAQLLVSQKLAQFRNLIIDHENTSSASELKVLSTDLDGFWSLVCIEVEDVYNKFKKLHAMKQNNWQELNVLPRPMRQIKPLKGKLPKVKGNASSGLRSFLAHVRNQSKQPEGIENSVPGTDSFGMSTSFGMSALPKPMSPVVMRVASKAKLIASPVPSTSNVPEKRTPLGTRNRIDNLPNFPQTPTSTKKTPRRRTTIHTPDSALLRRSTRLFEKQQL